MRALRNCVFMFLALLPSWVLAGPATLGEANGIIMGNANIFKWDQTDPTVNYLGQLFGTVGGVLHGTHGQLMGEVFRVFNIGVLVIAAIFFIFTIISTVTHSAYEGKFMGPKQSKPAFAILRTVFGFGLLVPLPSGYSMVQAFTMWIVLSGVGFANTAWNIALDYFNQGGVVMVQPDISTAENVDLSGTVLTAQVCMFHQQQEAQKKLNSNTFGSGTVEAFHPTFTNDNKSVRFPAKPGNKATDAGCGEFSWDAGGSDKNRYIYTAMQQLIADTTLPARHIVDPQGLSPSSVHHQVKEAVVNGAADWLNITAPVRAKTDQKITEFVNKAKSQGWIMAGQYYWDLTSLQSEASDNTRWQFSITKPILYITSIGGASGNMIDFQDTNTASANGFSSMISPEAGKSGSPSLKSRYEIAAGYIGDAKKLAMEIDEKTNENSGNKHSYMSMPDGGKSPMTVLLKPIFRVFNNVETTLTSNKATKTDPVLLMQVAGGKLMGIMTAVLIVGSVLVFSISAGMSIWSAGNPLGFAFRDMLNILLPAMLGLTTLLFVQGMIMAIYVPMVPFIIFLFAVIGWFVTVVESMAAAPLVALGLTHHEGHDMWGRSEEAIWLFLNVFLRPILMVIGLLGGMVLSRISLKLLMIGYAHINTSMASANQEIFYGVSKLLIFVSLVIVVVNVSYSLIYKIPDKVMRWLRAGGDQMGEFIQQAQRGGQDMTSQVAQGRAKMGQESMSSLGWRTTSGFQQYGEQQAKRKEEEAKTQATGPGGKAGSQTGNSSSSGAEGSSSNVSNVMYNQGAASTSMNKPTSSDDYK